MRSFRTEIENPIVEQDILDLEKKIRLFREGKADEEKFKKIAQPRKKPFHRILKSQQKRHRMVESNFMTSGLIKEMVELLS